MARSGRAGAARLTSQATDLTLRHKQNGRGYGSVDGRNAGMFRPAHCRLARVGRRMTDPTMPSARHAELRQLFTDMLGALGRKDFDGFETYVAEDALFEWPYPPVDDFAGSITGRSAFRKFCEAGMADCDPYNYSIQAIYDLVAPDTLIAEYTSHSFHHPRGIPYSNSYLGVFRYAGDQIVYWKEYINPLVVKRIYGDDFTNEAGRKAAESEAR
jgi:ketosteroid isomerase-like protein